MDGLTSFISDIGKIGSSGFAAARDITAAKKSYEDAKRDFVAAPPAGGSIPPAVIYGGVALLALIILTR